MSDYPKSLPEFQKLFPDEDACATWLFEVRWPDGFECPACGHKVTRSALHSIPENGSINARIAESRRPFVQVR